VRSLEEANGENRRIIAALTQRIPELEASARDEAPESPESGVEMPVGPIAAEAREVAQEPSDALGGPGSGTARG